MASLLKDSLISRDLIRSKQSWPCATRMVFCSCSRSLSCYYLLRSCFLSISLLQDSARSIPNDLLYKAELFRLSQLISVSALVSGLQQLLQVFRSDYDRWCLCSDIFRQWSLSQPLVTGGLAVAGFEAGHRWPPRSAVGSEKTRACGPFLQIILQQFYLIPHNRGYCKYKVHAMCQTIDLILVFTNCKAIEFLINSSINKNRYGSMRVNHVIAGVLLLVVALASEQIQLTGQPSNAVLQPPYTEDMSQFKDKKHYNARSQKLLACYLYLRDHEREAHPSLTEHAWLHLMKKCMQKITRKTAVLKITELGNRNMEPVPAFTSTLKIEEELQTIGAEQTHSEFDTFLLTRAQQFNKQLDDMLSKGNIEGQIDDEIKKRQKYYFGIIPASMVNHTTVLITVSMLMMMCCTCFRLFRANSQDIAQRLKKKRNQEEDSQEDEPMIKQKGSISRKNMAKLVKKAK